MVLNKLKSPIIIAHRGAGEPENSCLAFQNAIQSGYEGIELDIHKTKDGELIVHHDKKIKTRIFGPTIEKTTLKQLKNYNIGLNERIPTFKEALLILKGKTILDIEVKPANIGKEVAKKAIETLGLSQNWWISSFQKQVLIDVHTMDPDISVGYLYVRGSDKHLNTAINLGCDWIHPHHRFLTEDHVNIAQKSGMKVAPWTVNSINHIMRILHLNVDAIITDDPPLVMKLRQQYQKP